MKTIRLITMLLTLIAVFSATANVVITNDDETCNPVPGTLKWKFTPPEEGLNIFNALAISQEKTIYIVGLPPPHTSKDNAYLYALNSDGTLKWEFKSDGNFVGGLSPVIDKNEVIYIGFCTRKDHSSPPITENYLYAVNPDGTLKWKFLVGDILVQTCPAIGRDGAIYFGDDNGCFYALTPEGKLKWKFLAEAQIASSPAIDKNGIIYFGSSDKHVYALNPDGSLKWKTETECIIHYSSPAIDKDGTIYAGGYNRYSRYDYDGCFYAINSDGKIKWEIIFKNESVESSPVIGRDGTLYVGTHRMEEDLRKWHGNLYALNPDGTIKWKFEAGLVNSTPLLGDDGIIYITDYNVYTDSYLYALNPDGTLFWKFAGVNAIWMPSMDKSGTVYVTGSQSLYAINSSSKKLDPQSPWPKFHKDMANTGNVNY